MTDRQFRAWQAWLRDDWNRPDRRDGYLMQVACEARRVMMTNPNSVKPSDFVMRYDTDPKPPTPADKEVTAKLARARSLARMTTAVTVVSYSDYYGDTPDVPND